VKVRLAVFASGSGTNLQALLDRFTGSDATEVALVVSDRGGSGALERAQRAGVPTSHVRVGDREPDDVAGETLDFLPAHDIHLIALAGYLRLVPTPVVASYRDRIVNIHPALLPAFGGAGMYGRRVHQAVLDAGCMVTGATVHVVDERYDEGRILAQWPVPVLHGDSAHSLGQRVLAVEHRLYPAAVAAYARRCLDPGRSDGGVADLSTGDSAAPSPACFRLATSLDGIENEILALAGF
jgi:phosphoribosylglycinamide formyltransferase 1